MSIPIPVDISTRLLRSTTCATSCIEAACLCMCQVRKVIWRLFAIWPTAEAAAGASDDTLVIVEKLIQPLGLFRKRTLAIKRFSQDYLAAQVLYYITLA